MPKDTTLAMRPAPQKDRRAQGTRLMLDAYVAAPYSHPDRRIRRQRFNAANAYTARLSRQMILVYSPLTHGHPLAPHGLPTHWEYWANFNTAILQICRTLHVLRLDGWAQSIGVSAEIDIMTRLKRPVIYISEPFQ